MTYYGEQSTRIHSLPEQSLFWCLCLSIHLLMDLFHLFIYLFVLSPIHPSSHTYWFPSNILSHFLLILYFSLWHEHHLCLSTFSLEEKIHFLPFPAHLKKRELLDCYSGRMNVAESLAFFDCCATELLFLTDTSFLCLTVFTVWLTITEKEDAEAISLLYLHYLRVDPTTHHPLYFILNLIDCNRCIA